jgi:histidine triad (HIT) family protein
MLACQGVDGAQDAVNDPGIVQEVLAEAFARAVRVLRHGCCSGSGQRCPGNFNSRWAAYQLQQSLYSVGPHAKVCVPTVHAEPVPDRQCTEGFQNEPLDGGQPEFGVRHLAEAMDGVFHGSFLCCSGHPGGRLGAFKQAGAFQVDCLFCKIVAGAIPARKLYEDDQVVAFHDIAAQAPVHFLVIPKKHISTLNDLAEQDEQLAGHILLTARRLAVEQGCAEGFRLVMNCNALGGQTVYHIHMHVLGQRQMHWPPG